jgi:hypothetical protein
MNPENQILYDALRYIVDQWPDSKAGVHAYWALTKAGEERRHQEVSEHVEDELRSYDLNHPAWED